MDSILVKLANENVPYGKDYNSYGILRSTWIKFQFSVRAKLGRKKY